MSARARKQSKKSKGCGFWILVVVGIFAAFAAIGSVLPDTEPTSAPRPFESTSAQEVTTETEAVFVSATDGDTIETDHGTVRIIGIDTPERGQCGYEDATAVFTSELAAGDTIILESVAGQNDTDKYDRKLRYVRSAASGKDLGMMQIAAGNAVARYDSTDGYPAHPREDSYRTSQTATLLADGNVQTVACVPAAAPEPAPAPAPAPEPAPAPAQTYDWWMEYASCAALKRNPAGNPTGPFNMATPGEEGSYNWFAYGTGHNGDGDGDGLACE